MAREQRANRGSFRRYFPPKKKVCRFCQTNVKEIDYKNVDILKKYVPVEARFTREGLLAHVPFISENWLRP